MSDLRLGDEIDDYCVRCRRVTNHLIVSLMSSEPAKVRCHTCYSDHDFRHEKVPPSKRDLKKGQLFNEVLASVDPTALEPAAAEPDGEDAAKPEKKKKA